MGQGQHRWRRVAALAVLGVMSVAADGPTTPSPTPDGSNAPERLTDVVATCRVDRAREAQVVVCEVDDLPPSQVVRMTVDTAAVGSPPRTTWTGSATAGPSGSTTVRAALPCEAEGSVPVRVGADADGTYRHRQDVTLAGRCRPGWLLTGPELARLGATALVLITVMAVAVAHRRERAAARAAARARGRRTSR